MLKSNLAKLAMNAIMAFGIVLGTQGSSIGLAATPAETAFEKIKTLAGTWKVKEEGEDAGTVTYEVVSSGHAVVEEYDTMLTVYHLDGDTILVTHYCGAGNQPRMRATRFEVGLKAISFDFVDVTNLKPGKGHINAVKLEWIDANHVLETWGDKSGNGEQSYFTFALERVKQ